MSKNHTDISKFLSYVLRHQPEAVGLSLDKAGWAVITDLILCAKQEGYTLDPDIIQAIVASSDKKRFTISEDGLHIRAAQGHSTQQVDIAYQEKILLLFYIMEQPPALYLQFGSKVCYLCHASMYICPLMKSRQFR